MRMSATHVKFPEMRYSLSMAKGVRLPGMFLGRSSSSRGDVAAISYRCNQEINAPFVPGGSEVTQYVTDLQLKLRELVERLTNREEGQDMVEYALLAALISIVAIAIIILVGPYLKDLFQDVVNALGTA